MRNVFFLGDELGANSDIEYCSFDMVLQWLLRRFMYHIIKTNSLKHFKTLRFSFHVFEDTYVFVCV